MQQVGRRQGEIERVRMDADAAPANQIGRHRLVPARVDKVCIGKPEHRGKRKGLRHVSIRIAGDPLGLGAGLELGTAGSSAMASCTSD